MRDRALFDFAIDSKLRGCDVVKIKIGDVMSGGRVKARALVVQQKTGRPVQFELLEPARNSILAWLEHRGGALDDFVFPSRLDRDDPISTRHYARLVAEWIAGIGLRSDDDGTHSLRRTKASISYKQTGNLRAVQILLTGLTVCASCSAGMTRTGTRRGKRSYTYYSCAGTSTMGHSGPKGLPAVRRLPHRGR